MTDAAVIGRVASVIAHEPEAAISKLSRQAHPRTYLNRYLIARAPAVLAVGAVAQRSIAGILAKLGHPGATLDDSYIHFQYARALAEGHALR